jgi:hypothetical protein
MRRSVFVGSGKDGFPRNVVDIASHLARCPAMANLSQYTIVTYERTPGHWRAAITPYQQPRAFIQGKMASSIVTPDDFDSESGAQLAAEKMIKLI